MKKNKTFICLACGFKISTRQHPACCFYCGTITNKKTSLYKQYSFYENEDKIDTNKYLKIE